MDAGNGVDVLFELLQALKNPFILAGGNQLSALPEKARSLLVAAEKSGQALAPEWLDQVAVLKHPVRPS